MGIRRKCDWYEYGEKSSKIFLNLAKSRAAQSAIRNITKKSLHVIKRLIRNFFTSIKIIFRKF